MLGGCAFLRQIMRGIFARSILSMVCIGMGSLLSHSAHAGSVVAAYHLVDATFHSSAAATSIGNDGQPASKSSDKNTPIGTTKTHDFNNVRVGEQFGSPHAGAGTYFGAYASDFHAQAIAQIGIGSVGNASANADDFFQIIFDVLPDNTRKFQIDTSIGEVFGPLNPPPPGVTNSDVLEIRRDSPVGPLVEQHSGSGHFLVTLEPGRYSLRYNVAMEGATGERGFTEAFSVDVDPVPIPPALGSGIMMLGLIAITMKLKRIVALPRVS